MNRRRTKRIISVLVLLSLLLSACGSPEKKLQKEDAAIRAAIRPPNPGSGRVSPPSAAVNAEFAAWLLPPRWPKARSAPDADLLSRVLRFT